MTYPKETHDRVREMRPDIEEEGIQACLTADPTLTAEDIIESLDEAASDHATEQLLDRGVRAETNDIIDEIWVIDPEGGIWWPDDEANAELIASENPTYAAVKMVATAPWRGTWHQ